MKEQQYKELLRLLRETNEMWRDTQRKLRKIDDELPSPWIILLVILDAGIIGLLVYGIWFHYS